MVTITLKGVSVTLYKRLKTLAAAEHRSLNRQAIMMLEQQAAQRSIDVKAWLEETDRLRKRLGVKPSSLTMADIDAAKRRGRP